MYSSAWGKRDDAGGRPHLAHHGRPVQPPSRAGSDRFAVLPHYDRRTEDRLMGQAMRRWFAPAFGAGPAGPAAGVAFLCRGAGGPGRLGSRDLCLCRHFRCRILDAGAGACCAMTGRIKALITAEPDAGAA